MGRGAGILRVAGLAGLVATTILTTVMVLTPPVAPPPAADLDRADAYVAQVESRMAQRAEAALDAVTVKVVFPPDRPLRVLLVGDAITLGSSASTEGTRYRSLLAAGLESKGPVELTVLASSATGGTLKTDELAARLPARKAFDLVLVMVGTNEAAKADLAGFTAAYPGLISAVRAASPTAGLLCLGSWGDKKSTAEFDRLAEDACGRNQGRFRPLNGLFQSEKNRWADKKLPDGRATDNFFPSDLGHAAIAKTIQAALRFPDPKGASQSMADQRVH